MLQKTQGLLSVSLLLVQSSDQHCGPAQAQNMLSQHWVTSPFKCEPAGPSVGCFKSFRSLTFVFSGVRIWNVALYPIGEKSGTAIFQQSKCK